MNTDRYVLGIDIGGTKCAISVGEIKEDSLSIIFREETPTLNNPVETLSPLFVFAKKWIKEFDIKKAGISCGGPLNSKKGLILCPPNLLGWENFEIVKYVNKELNIKSYLDNDANAGAIAEHLFGAGRGYDNIIFITCGTGLGAGLILNGKIYRGANDNAGEIGHIRLDNKGPVGYNKKGSLEGYASGGGITRLAIQMAEKEKEMPKCIMEMGGYENVTTKKLGEYAHNGDAFAIKVFNKAGKMFGKGLAILIDTLNPELIVIGGVFMRAGDLLIKSMQREIKKEALSYSRKVCKIVPCGLKENIGDIAAISIAIGE